MANQYDNNYNPQGAQGGYPTETQPLIARQDIYSGRNDNKPQITAGAAVQQQGQDAQTIYPTGAMAEKEQEEPSFCAGLCADVCQQVAEGICMRIMIIAVVFVVVFCWNLSNGN